jgi:membrane associated rhomboid family serine protease
MIALLEHLDQEDASTYSLVLNAVGIGNRVVPSSEGFRIEVPEPFVDAARETLRRYRAENPRPVTRSSALPDERKRWPVSGIIVALMLLAAHLAVTTSAAPDDYSRVFGADARRILSGELYRCATALVVHADATHLAGNMAGIALFGGALSSLTGAGLGWLLVLACGTLGNLMNAWAYQTNHLSVGASTAVFGAVGVLCAIQAVNAAKTGQGWKRVAVIAGAGAALLAFLGASPHSDLGAHLFGGLAGMLAGGACGLWMRTMPTIRWQMLWGALGASVMVLSWFRGAVG